MGSQDGGVSGGIFRAALARRGDDGDGDGGGAGHAGLRIGISIWVGGVYDAITGRASTDWRVAACPPTRSCASRAVGTAGTVGGAMPAGGQSVAPVGQPPTPKVPAWWRGVGAVLR